MEERYNHGAIQRYRVKFILFKDYSCNANAITESDFMDITSPDSISLADGYIDSIEFSGGYGYCNATEAIAKALRSDWAAEEGQKRLNVIVFSNGRVRPLNGNQRLLSTYPENMPEELSELGAWWELPREHGLPSLDYRYAFMVFFVPNSEPWVGMQPWNRCYFVFSDVLGTDHDGDEIGMNLEMLADD